MPIHTASKRKAAARMALWLSVAALSASTPGYAGNKMFQNPKIHGHRLDWCKTWGDGCGKPAAQAFCWYNDLDKVVSFQQDPTPGSKTEVISSGQICDDPSCASFKVIVCAPKQAQAGNLENDEGLNPMEVDNPPGGKQEASSDAPLMPGDKVIGDMVQHTFLTPKWKGARLDWCRVWGDECGKPAATEFCQAKGYANAKKFNKDTTPVATKVISSDQKCSDSSCRSFSKIICERALHG